MHTPFDKIGRHNKYIEIKWLANYWYVQFRATTPQTSFTSFLPAHPMQITPTVAMEK